MLTSTKGGSGKSVVAIGMFLKFRDDEGKNLGYFKPIGDKMSMTPKTRTDKDVNVISAVVARKFSKEEICPQFLSPGYFLDEVTLEETGQIKEKIKDTYQSMVSKGLDVMIIEGNHSCNQFRSISLDDAYFAKEFDSEVIICCPVSDDDDINDLVSVYDWYKCQGINVKGVILNGVSDNAFTRIEQYHKPLLEKLGIPFIGGLKKSKQLEKPTISEIMEAVNGRLIVGNYIKVKYNTIEGFVIGAMGSESAVSYLRRGRDKCVITGGDRSDIALAALETSTALIIFTGNIEPAPHIQSKAEEKGIPLIVAPGDTYTVSEQVKKIHTHIQPNEIGICKEQADKYLDWEKVLE